MIIPKVQISGFSCLSFKNKEDEGKMKIFDCFMYLDEDVTLDLRLNYLNNIVDMKYPPHQA